MLHSFFAFDGADTFLDRIALCFLFKPHGDISICLCMLYLYCASSVFLSCKNAESCIHLQ